MGVEQNQVDVAVSTKIFVNRGYSYWASPVCQMARDSKAVNLVSSHDILITLMTTNT